MFNTGNWKQKAGLMALGSVFTIIGMLFAIGMLPSVTAQRDKFGEIECTKLTLVDSLTGETTAKLRTDVHGGLLHLFGAKENRGAAKLVVDKHGGGLIMFSNENKGSTHLSAALLTSEDGTGAVSIYHKNGGKVHMSAIDDGGFVSIEGRHHEGNLASIAVTDDGASGMISVYRYDRGMKTGAAQLMTDENGGRLNVYGKEGTSRVRLGVNENGGLVQVDGKGEGSALMGINEYGNGAVSTWDKNGYRQ